MLTEQERDRVEELIPIRHGRMLDSPFAYFRGAAAMMAADLAKTPSTGLTVQLCGDAHLSNFGGFAAPDRYLVFDVNDFDETLPGPFEWDVKRLAASLEIAARDDDFTAANERIAVLAAVSEYRETMRNLAAKRHLDVWYARLDEEHIRSAFEGEAGRTGARAIEHSLSKAHTKDSLRALAKLTHRIDGEIRIISHPPLITPLEEVSPGAGEPEAEESVRELLRSYRASLPDERRALLERYRYVHSARKVVGVGSVGTRAWIVLLLGRDEGDPLFLQVKEAQASVLEPHAEACRYRHQGRRVVEGQRLMQTASDIFLGWLTATGADGQSRDCYVRQLWDWKASAHVDRMSPKALDVYARMCGWTLARAHARAGDRIAIASYLGGGESFDNAIADFAHAYADQNERDYRQLQAAVDDGRIEARVGL